MVAGGERLVAVLTIESLGYVDDDEVNKLLSETEEGNEIEECETSDDVVAVVLWEG